MEIRILTDRVNHVRDIEEVRQAWLDDLLSFVGLDLEIIHNSPRDVVVEYFIENKIENWSIIDEQIYED